MTEDRPLTCTVVLPIGGLLWADDATRAEAVLAGRPGVLHVQAHLDRGTATVTYDQHQTTEVTLWNWLAASRAGRGPPTTAEAEPDASAGAGR